ncbi:MAG: beta-galactosidase [Verrucomicrobia bacterium]|nr:beta-galactosidase [Verrucomicrobiota bacterium]
MKIGKRILFEFLIWMTLSRLAAAVEFPGWQPYDKLSPALVSPHIPFANPYAGGKLTALVIAPCWTQRETIELAQRLSLNSTPLMTESYECFGVYPTGERKDYLRISAEEFQQVVREKTSRTYDLIIIGKMRWSVIYPEVQAWILNSVKKGAGVIYVTTEDLPPELAATVDSSAAGRPAILDGVPVKVLPVSKDVPDEKLVRTGSLGQGRTVVIHYGQKYDEKEFLTCWVDSLTPFNGDDPLYYDYHHALLAKACLWAAGKTSSAWFEDLPTSAEVALGETPATLTLSFRLAGDAKGSLSCTLRNRKGEVECEQTVARAGNDVALAVPVHTAGDKLLDLWLKDAQGNMINWASVPVTVRATFGIAAIALDREFYNAGDMITGAVHFSGEPPADTRLTFEVFDNLGRKILADTPAVREKRAEISFRAPPSLTVLHQLRVTAISSSGVTVTGETVFYVNTDGVLDDEREFPLFVFGTSTGNSRTIRLRNEQFRKEGIDVCYATGAYWQNFEQSRAIAKFLTKFNLNASPYATHIAFAMEQHEHVRPVQGPDGPEIRNCVLSQSPAEHEKNSQLKHLRDIVEAYRHFAPAFYSLGDEDVLSFPYSDVCFCANCQGAFREYLQEVYPNIEALNKEWGVSHPTWAEVKPITLLEAQKQNRYPQWMDHRLFMDRQFTRYHILCAGEILKIVPQAKVGSEGAMHPSGSGSGWNWYELLPHLKFFGPYRSPIELRAGLSWFPKDGLMAAWFGSYRGETHEQHMRYFPWATLLDGCNSIGWWPAIGSGLGGPSTVAPDGTPLLHFRQAMEEIRAIRSGIGTLLLSCDRQSQPIGVYYSNHCLHASNLKPKLSSWENSLKDFHYVLADGRYDYRYISPPDMGSGKLKDLKVLILPYALAISPGEVEQIKAFVQAGGLLIADFLPAIMDEHGKELEQSALQDVFGEFARLKVRPVGKGHAVCLADYIKGYHRKRSQSEGKGVAAGFGRLIPELTGGKVKPFFCITNDQDELRQDIESSLFKNGKALYLGMVRGESVVNAVKAAGAEGGAVSGAVTGENSPVVNIQLPERYYVYELRENQLMGHVDQFTIQLAPAQAKVFALLPSQVAKFELTVDKKNYQPGETIKFQANVLPATLKDCGLCIRTELAGPDGKTIPHYTRKIVSKDGAFKGSIQLSLNEKPGPYKLVAKDIISGLEAVQTLQIK